ncbi:hypothetical protein [Massilia sp. S19_KUP03_FR1]|uniref:hypothetical protein n=1 Tax=Massilia sp. S19_KUP03_FR1 TaxID=3025503 RepID=UPI002FCD01C0
MRSLYSGFGKSLRLGLGTDAIALVDAQRWRRAPVDVLAEASLGASGLDHLAVALRAMLQDADVAGRALTVIVSDELARLWQVSPPDGSARMADLEGAAALRFQALYGAAPVGWRIGADWSVKRPFLAAGLPAALLALLEEIAAEQSLRLVEVTPQFVAAFNGVRAKLADDAWFGVLQAGVLTLGVQAVAGHLGAVRAVAVPAGADGAWLATHVTREALRLDVPAPGRLQLCGDAPSNWQTQGKLACTLFDAGRNGAGWSAPVRLACSGSRA